jgi:hypothetical protein
MADRGTVLILFAALGDTGSAPGVTRPAPGHVGP